MPEGPEVKRQADRIRAILGDRVARVVYFAFPQLREAGRSLEGRRVRSVDARGKALLLGFEGERVVYTHNQLYGRWYVRTSGGRPSTRRTLRFAVETDRGAAWLYSASTVEVLDASMLADHPFLGRLGPDVLGPDTTVETFRERLRESRFRRRTLGALLLDQTFLAGLGNYLRSEILFRARVHPAKRPMDLEASQVRRLADAIQLITNRAYRGNGVTNDPRVAARKKAAGERRRAYRHYVFGRAGLPCPRCDTPIEKQEVAGRRLYACGSCQSLRS